MFTTPPGSQPGVSQWIAVRPSASPTLTDARLQTHHAAQLIAAVGVSYLPPQPDDSHTSFEWVREHRGLFSSVISTPKAQVRFGLRTRDLTLLRPLGKDRERVVLDEWQNARACHRVDQIRGGASRPGSRAVHRRQTVAEIPPHPVGDRCAVRQPAWRLTLRRTVGMVRERRAGAGATAHVGPWERGAMLATPLRHRHAHHARSWHVDRGRPRTG